MARVLLAWEIGGAYGHLMRFATLAQELARRGHAPVFAVCDLTHVDEVFKAAEFPVFQAPAFASAVSGLPTPLGFAETLMRLGFIHVSALAGMVRGWRSLMNAVRPDLLVFDYAPTALLATRGVDVPRIRVGTSFCAPPRTTPMPIYRWWRPESTARVADAERIVLANANQVLSRFSQPPMQRLADLLDTDDEVITASAEFDQYPSRTDGRYWGDLANLEHGVAPVWPRAAAKRVFVYLRPRFRDFALVMDALRGIDAAVLVHAPGIATAQMQRLSSANMAFSDRPLRMIDVRRECDLAICHGGSSTVEAIVTAGKPVLVLPQHIEQLMTAKRVQQLGAGLATDYEKPPPDYRRLIRRLLEEPSFTQVAAAIAERHAHDDDRDTRVSRVVDRFEALMRTATPDRAGASQDAGRVR
jgi:UDP:flavonoid glycosyltransferase YjiC (YdhE family)